MSAPAGPGGDDLFVPLLPPPGEDELPRRFPSPFDARAPHPLALRAKAALAGELAARFGEALPVSERSSAEEADDRTEGKMFAVLVVRDGDGRVGYLRGFSGMLAGEWLAPGFVPPMFELAAREPWWSEAQDQLRRWDEEWRELAHGAAARALREQRAQLEEAQRAELSAMKLRHRLRREARRAARQTLEHEQAGGLAAAEGAQRLRALDRQSSDDGAEERACKASQRAARDELERVVASLDARRDELARLRAAASAGYQRRLNDLYRVPSCDGQVRPLRDVYAPGNPPGGAGDCAGPKLLAYAIGAGLTPLLLAELWWGPPPLGGGRHHGQLYPACRGKCGPLLPVMLRGLDVEEAPLFGATETETETETETDATDGDPAAQSNRQSPTLDLAAAPGELVILYEDEAIVAVAKPCGLLSVPGRSAELRDSVLTRLRARYPAATGPLLVHRLDLDTSGVLLAAKDATSHTLLQRQFAHREIEKRYVAILDGELREDRGVIQLALRTDVEDRPRQIYDPVHGKLAITHWHVLERGAGTTRVALFPHTGRTHQLRVHAAHPLGLAAPIRGDRLYGRAARERETSEPEPRLLLHEPEPRLLLHAERLAFVHPTSGRRLELVAPAPF